MPLNKDVEPPKPKPGNKPKPTKRKAYKSKTAAKSNRTSTYQKHLKEAQKHQKAAERAKKRLESVQSYEKMDSGESAVMEKEQTDQLPPTLQETLKDREVIFQPNEGPQTDFLAATEREVFYGGARGGGKSYAMLVDPLRFVDNGNHRALILRRTMPELRQLILESQKLYKRAYPGAKWREQDKLWRFPSGAQVEFGYAENYQDVMRYQGQSYTWIGVDELPQFPDESIWQFLRSCLRSTDPSLPVYMRATGNPGNIGSMWVKEKFIDPVPPNTRFTETIEIDTPVGRRTEQITRRFIPAKVWDNPYLTYDSHYVGMLATLPEAQRRQYLEGDWTAFDNAAFSEFDKPAGTHVVEPFEIPKGWLKFRAADWGYSSPACCLWFAIDFDNNLWVYREYYTKKETADEFAKNVLELEKHDGNIRYGVLDSSVWAQRGEVGPSIAETMIREGCHWRPADRSPKSRVSSKLELHRRLAVNPTTGEPGLRVFNTCRNLIRTLPMLPLDDKNPEDVDTDAEDHAYDALRYGCQSRPINPSSLAEDWGGPLTPRPPATQADDPVFGY